MKSKKQFGLLAVGLSLSLILAGCATVMNGTSQDIGVSSSPTGASVKINGQNFGTTPVVAKLSRKDNHTVKLEMPGYAPHEMVLTKSVSGWVWGNIVFGGVVGLAVDAISGGIYKLSPEQVQAEMKNGAVSAVDAKGQVYVTVVMQPQKDWKKIGDLAAVSQ